MGWPGRRTGTVRSAAPARLVPRWSAADGHSGRILLADQVDDSDYRLTRSLGITFTASPEQQERDRAKGGGLAAELGTGQWELPYPTIVVLDSRGVVTFADVHPDWLIRTEAPTVIDAVRALVEAGEVGRQVVVRFEVVGGDLVAGERGGVTTVRSRERS